jgi:predicted phosphodiesterase
MRTLVISDLHLGTRSGADVLVRPEALDVLCSRLDGVDRLVLLGDTLELRHGPARDALARAEPVMRALGDALGSEGQVVIVAGNHDHAIAAGWLDWRGRRDEPEPLGLDERVAPQYASWIVKRLAGWLAPASVEVAYPGLWLRDDVYATHGHYLDVHCVIPTLEVLSGRAMARMVGAVPRQATPDDYEAVLAPLYAWIQASAQRAAPRRRSAGAGSAIGVWRALDGADGMRTPRRAALRTGFRATIAVANRAGFGPLRAEVSGPALRRGGLGGLAEAAGRLGLSPAHLVFGHTHRTGKLERDDPGEWRTPSGTQLHNVGCWVFESHFMGRLPRGASPYWPGGAIALDDDGPPRLERLLGELSAEVLGAASG